MAAATIESSLIEQADVSTSATILRNNDPLSRALRDGIALEVDDIARLNQAMPPPHDALSSVETSSTAVFSSREESTITKPTSADTSTPTVAHNDKGKRKLKTGYASSLSVTHGSASEAEVERRALRRNNLFALGEWADTTLEPSRPLKCTVRARDRQQSRRKSKQKKPLVVIRQDGRDHGSSEERDGLIVTTAPSYGSTGKTYLRHRSPKHDEDPIRLAEEGQPQSHLSQCTDSKPLSRARVQVLSGLIVLKVLTLALSAYGAYLTGRARMSCTKCIVFAATALLALFTVLAMLIARRALSEALLAGLIEFVFGFALVVELDDFM